MSQQRNQTISIARGLCIILMVIGHSGIPEYMCKFIYLFHMPFFFFVSGYFERATTTLEELKDRILRRFKRLYIPFAIYGIFFICTNNLFCYLGLLDAENRIVGSLWIDTLCRVFLGMRAVSELMGTFWFIKTLLLCSVMIDVCLFLMHRMKYWLQLLISGAIVLTLLTELLPGNTPGMWDITHTLLASVFFLAGLAYRKLQDRIPAGAVPMTLSLAVLIAFTLFYPRDLDINVTGYVDRIAFIVTGVIGSFFVLSLSMYLRRKMTCRFLQFCGDNSLHFMALNFLAFKPVSFIAIRALGLDASLLASFPFIQCICPSWCILYSAAGVIIPFAFSYLLLRLRLKSIA